MEIKTFFQDLHKQYQSLDLASIHIDLNTAEGILNKTGIGSHFFLMLGTAGSQFFRKEALREENDLLVNVNQWIDEGKFKKGYLLTVLPEQRLEVILVDSKEFLEECLEQKKYSYHSIASDTNPVNPEREKKIIGTNLYQGTDPNRSVYGFEDKKINPKPAEGLIGITPYRGTDPNRSVYGFEDKKVGSIKQLNHKSKAVNREIAHKRWREEEHSNSAILLRIGIFLLGIAFFLIFNPFLPKDIIASDPRVTANMVAIFLSGALGLILTFVSIFNYFTTSPSEKTRTTFNIIVRIIRLLAR